MPMQPLDTPELLDAALAAMSKGRRPGATPGLRESLLSTCIWQLQSGKRMGSPPATSVAAFI